MNEVMQWIHGVAEESGRQFLQLDQGAAREVVAKARELYVEGNPRVWWLALKGHKSILESKGVPIENVLPTGTRFVWFIPETEEQALPVFHLEPGDIELIRNEAPPFEYYVVDCEYQWLVAETDHDDFVICRREA